MFFVFVLYALFGFLFPMSKEALFHCEPLFLIGSRMFLAGLLLIAYQVFVKKASLNLPFRQFILLFFMGIVGIYLTNFLEFYALMRLSAGETCFIYSLSPFISALFSYWIFKEVMTFRKWVGLSIGFLALLPGIFFQSSGKSIGLGWPQCAMLGAAIASVISWIMMRQAVKNYEISPALANGISMFFGGLLALSQSYMTEKWNPIPVLTDFPSFIVTASIVMVISNLVCYNLYGYLLKRYTATFMSFVGFTTPFFAAFFGWVLLKENVSWTFFLENTFVLIGLIIFYKEEIRQGYVTHYAQKLV